MNAGTPRELVAAAAAAIVLVVVASVAQPDGGVSALVVLICELLLAGGAANLLDDPAVALTSVTPVRSVAMLTAATPIRGRTDLGGLGAGPGSAAVAGRTPSHLCGW